MEPDLALMERIFALLRHDWVWDFLFDSSSVELDMVRHAVTKEEVATVEWDIATLATAPKTEAFLVGENHRLLLMPSFTAGSITVGFAINERISSSSNITSRDKYLGRIVRDDDKGSCLFLAENFNDHFTEVSYFLLHTPASREHVFSLFHSKPFFRAMKHFRRKKEIDFPTLTRAVVYFFSATEARPCPQCGPDAKKKCSCKIMIPRKMHASDANVERIALRSYAGGYNGIASLQLFSNGKSVYQATYPSSSRCDITVDNECRRRLSLFALCDSAHRRTISPLALCMGRGGLLGQGSVSPLDTFLLASIADSVAMDATPRKSKKKLTVASDTDAGLGASKADTADESDVDGDLDDNTSRYSRSEQSGPRSSMISRVQPDSVKDGTSPAFSASNFLVQTSPAPSCCSIPSLLAPEVPSLSTIANLKPSSAEFMNLSENSDANQGTSAMDTTAPDPAGVAVAERSNIPPTQTAQPTPPSLGARAANIPIATAFVPPIRALKQVQVDPTVSGTQLGSLPLSAGGTMNPVRPTLAQAYSRALHGRSPSIGNQMVQPVESTSMHSVPMSLAPPGPMIPSPTQPVIAGVPSRPTSVAGATATDGMRASVFSEAAGREAAMDLSDGSHGTASEVSGLSTATRRESRSGAAVIAPAPGPLHVRFILPHGIPAPPSTIQVAGGIDKTGEELDERIRKAELRKARNRESAQRSNHKRKLRIQALKDDIAAAASREMSLRAREKVLREENTSLRRGLMST